MKKNSKNCFILIHRFVIRSFLHVQHRLSFKKLKIYNMVIISTVNIIIVLQVNDGEKTTLLWKVNASNGITVM